MAFRPKNRVQSTDSPVPPLLDPSQFGRGIHWKLCVKVRCISHRFSRAGPALQTSRVYLNIPPVLKGVTGPLQLWLPRE